MAEAAVEDSTSNRFFCHKCSIEITRVLEDYTCPTCRGGFIEELDSTNTSSDEPSDVHSDDEMDEFFSDEERIYANPPLVWGRKRRIMWDSKPKFQYPLNPLECHPPSPVSRLRNLQLNGTLPEPELADCLAGHAVFSNDAVQTQFGQYFFGRDGGRGNQDRESRNPDDESVEGDGTGRRYINGTNFNLNLRPRGGNIFGRYNSIEHRIQDFIVNLTGVGWGPMGPGGRGNEPVFFLGNPGDYAWGRGGLDVIVTQLLNQMDGTGPPPLDKEKIREIPVTVIEQEQVDSNLQCSVCWDDFKVGETVRKLECEHFYHESCIVPWLELHGTCPICRKSLVGEEEEKTPVNSGSNSSRPTLARVFHAVHNRASANTRSASSSSANSTSTSSTNPPNGRQPPPSDFQMDLEYDES